MPRVGVCQEKRWRAHSPGQRAGAFQKRGQLEPRLRQYSSCSVNGLKGGGMI